MQILVALLLLGADYWVSPNRKAGDGPAGRGSSRWRAPRCRPETKSLVDLQTRIDVTRLGIAALKAVPKDRFTGGDLRYEKNRIWSPGADSAEQDDIVSEFK